MFGLEKIFAKADSSSLPIGVARTAVEAAEAEVTAATAAFDLEASRENLARKRAAESALELARDALAAAESAAADPDEARVRQREAKLELEREEAIRAVKEKRVDLASKMAAVDERVDLVVARFALELEALIAEAEQLATVDGGLVETERSFGVESVAPLAVGHTTTRASADLYEARTLIQSEPVARAIFGAHDGWEKNDARTARMTSAFAAARKGDSK